MRLWIIALATLMTVFMAGCNTPPDPRYYKDGRQFGVVKGLFRERWWNFYERGASFIEGGFWQEAVADFSQAIAQRDKDQRRARTYGMHLVDYFPHRDRGIAYYHLGRYQEAQHELETSLASVETARAKFYLNKVRKALLETTHADTAAPVITAAADIGDKPTNSFRTTIHGEVADDCYAGSIAVNGEPLFLELSAKKIPFAKEIRLKKGLNEIHISSADLLGKATEHKVKVLADFEGPLLTLKDHRDGQQVPESKVVLHGALADATGVASLRINEQLIAYNKEREVEFAFAMNLKQGSNVIAMAATDLAGNVTTGSLELVYVPRLAGTPRGPAAGSSAGRPMLLAMNSTGMLDTGQDPLWAVASQQSADARPKLTLQGLSESQTVFHETMAISGCAAGNRPITRVSINGSPLLIVPSGTVYFSQRVQLEPGENRFSIAVQDEGGSDTSTIITIFRKIPAVRQTAARLRLAVLPFIVTGQGTGAAQSAGERLRSALASQGRFNLVDTGRAPGSVLSAQTSGEADRTAASRGRELQADAVLTGTVHETPHSIEIAVRLIDAETNALIEAHDVFGQETSPDQIDFLVNGLALKCALSLPLLEGTVTRIEGRTVHAGFSTAERLKSGMNIIIFRMSEDNLHPITGISLGRDAQELGIARVVTIHERMVMAELAPAYDHRSIKADDLVITK
jgi:TolB-like protein/tetratricopeptide (TPR) repeat protein